jgi:Ca2+-binding RTX toxin-like protein
MATSGDGGAGLDQLSGGAGADTFVLAPSAASADTINNFRPVDDTLEISAALFGGGLTAGSLDATSFATNTTGRAGDPDVRFIFNSNTGELFFDSNGDATGGRSLIATFTGVIPSLAADDFLIV